jgi:chromosome segregation ATPase
MRANLESDQLSNLKVVTLRGEVFYASGQVIAGQEKSPGTLSRPRQRRELGTIIVEVERNLAKLRDELEQLEVRREAQKKEEDRLVENLIVSQHAVEKARIAHSQDSLSIEHTRRQVDWQKERALLLEEETIQGENEIVEIEREISAVAEEVIQTQSRLKEVSVELLNLPLEEIQMELSHWNLRTAVVELAVTEARGRHDEKAQMLEKAQLDLSQINNQQSELISTIET